MHKWGIVNQADQLQGKDGALALFDDREVAEKERKKLEGKSKGKEKLFVASFKLKHNMTYGKVL